MKRIVPILIVLAIGGLAYGLLKPTSSLKNALEGSPAPDFARASAIECESSGDSCSGLCASMRACCSICWT